MTDTGELIWPSARALTTAWQVGALGFACRPLGPAALVTGRLAPALATLGVGTLHGWGPPVDKPPYALARSHDKALAVLPEPPVLADGWYEEGYAVSDATGAHVVIDVEGGTADELMRHLAAVDLSRPGPSAALRLAGFTVYAARRSAGVRFIVPAPDRDSFCASLTDAAARLAHSA